MSARIWSSIWLIGLAGWLMVQSPPAWGEDPAAALDDHARAVNRAAKTPRGEQRVVERLSQELKVPAATLRAKREQSKLGWGELSIAYRLSEKTGVPVDQLIAEHKDGKGWGAIAKEHNVKLGPLVSEVKKSSRAVEAKAKKAEKEDEADHGGKGKGHPGHDGGPGHGGGAGHRGGPGGGRGK